jgi:hypothetical protein
MRAHNAGGFGPVSSWTGDVYPKVSFAGDNIPSLFASYSCGACHSAGTTPILGGAPATMYSSIISNTANVHWGSRALIVSCPSGGTCPTGHMQFFAPYSLPYDSLLMWVQDGANP